MMVKQIIMEEAFLLGMTDCRKWMFEHFALSETDGFMVELELTPSSVIVYRNV